ncbi:hypothetical protein L6164_037715 [Bauhinia variegata]|uniref:Uncharacterized protein n=1 Tax=Bauhinia variegata TaxID=167791 RepID=A0ACB9KLN6_BAUVA|nr:hypothetical protein L6164_037715 [Bauhinia variegata]
MAKKGVVVQVLLVVAITVCCLGATEAQSQSLGFECRSDSVQCRALIDYTAPNNTNYRAIQKLFNVKHLIDIVGANSLPANTNGTDPVNKGRTIRIPFGCKCRNSTGLSSNRRPVYTVQSGDTLSHIAEEVFSRLVTWQQIQAANNLTDPNKIDVGQEFWIPLPCSCDQVNDTTVVHYGHVVASGSTVQQIAQQYGTTQDTLLNLNNMTDPNKLQAGQILDVPLKACGLNVKNESLDFHLLVADTTELYTANGCVKCRCDTANNLTVQCEPSQAKPANWSTCPTMQCQTSDSVQLFIGNATDSCPRTTCAYAGYAANQTIFTTLVTDSTCPASGASRITLPSSFLSIFFASIAVYQYFSCLFD